MDNGADINLISQHYVVQEGLQECQDAALPRPSWFEKQSAYCYGAYEVTYEVTDSWGRKAISSSTFYAVSFAMVDRDAVLGGPALKKLRAVIYMENNEWRHSINHAFSRIEEPKEFARTLEESEVPVFAMIVSGSVGSVDANGKPVPVVPSELRGYDDVFSNEAARVLPEQKQGDHAIELDDREPPYGPLYNLSRVELEELRRYLDDALAKGWIRHSTSPAGAPILFVPKKDGGLRLCVDYRGLNAVTVKNRHPLPLISETLDRLSGARRYTKLDLKDAYHRIRIRSGDEWKTAFRTRYGHFEYLVMPFGLANAPATFQAYINRALAGLVDVTCVVYLDDILIFSKNPDDHWQHVKEVLDRLRQYQLYVHLKKCEFATTQVEFLGFIVSTDGVAMDDRRVQTIKEWPYPKSYREVQVFLGFANFYRRFIHKYSAIAGPLTGLLKGSKGGKKSGPFDMGYEAEAAFINLRQCFTEAPLLIHFDPERKIRIETDASIFALAGILSQKGEDGHWHPVAFWSRKMIPAEQNYETHDAELLAIVASFKQWRHYLEGSLFPIEVLTDHNNLKGFMKLKELTPRQARWAIKLANYDFEILHRAGKTNPADPPSRRPDYDGDSPLQTKLLPTLQRKLALWEGQSCHVDELDAVKHVMSVADVQVIVPRKQVAEIVESAYDESQRPMKSLLHDLQSKDKRVQDVIQQTPSGKRLLASKAWSFDKDGLLRYGKAIYVPDGGAVREELIRKCHDDVLAGHFGVDKTLELLKRKYHWHGMATEVSDYVKTCDICQRVKVYRHRPYGELQSLPVPEGPWKELTMDFITDLPPSKRKGIVYDSILVILDRYTKMVKYIPVQKTINAVELAELFMEQIVTQFGLPDGIVSDRGSVFTSEFWSSVCYHLSVRRRLSTAFHPQTDGQTERQNQVLEHYLRCYSNADQNNWAKILPLAEFAYNNSTHSATGQPPFFLMYGYHPKMQYEVEGDSIQGRVPAAYERVKSLLHYRKEMEEHLRIAVASYSKYYNKTHTPREFKVGELVMLSTKNLKQKRPSKKMSHKFVGPFRIEDRIGKQAYRLTMPTKYRIHNTFHVSLLEPYNRRTDNVSPDNFMPPPELVDDEERWEIEEIIGRTKSKGETWYEVKWLGWNEEYNEWVPAKDLGRAEELTKTFDKRLVKKRKRARK